MYTSNRAWLYPNTIERNYIRDLWTYSYQITKETEKRYSEIKNVRIDAEDDEITSEEIALFIASLLLFARYLESSITIRLSEIFRNVSKFNDKQWISQVKSATGLSIGGEGIPPSDLNSLQNKFGKDFDLFRAEPWMNKLMDNWVAENVRLIKSIPAQYLGNVEGIIRRGIQSGLSIKELAKQIEQTGLVTNNRAKLIARDQIGKANAALTQYRQQDLGLDSYIWQTAQDDRVRTPEHSSLHGNVIRWDSPPKIGHAGTPINCRCKAKPIFK